MAKAGRFSVLLSSQPPSQASSLLKQQWEKIMQASSPYAPVMSAGKRLSEDFNLFPLQESIIRCKTVKEPVLRSHGAVKDAKAFPKLLRMIQQREAAFVLLSPRRSQKPAEQPRISEQPGI